MAKYREKLPQLSEKLFLTDGGMETTMIFHEGLDLPFFASFDLLRTRTGENQVMDYYRRYAAIARDNGVGFVLESPTWRASESWGKQMGYSETALTAINLQAIEMLEKVRDEFECDESPMVISGCIGPRGDGYNPTDFMSINESREYHARQIENFASSNSDMITAMTMNYVEEAIGVVLAAKEVDIPVVISFTVETDGRLPSGQTLQDALEMVDLKTNKTPVYYMINCAHPTHFENVLNSDKSWLNRIRGLRANASCKSHAELDEATELDDGNPLELGEQYKAFKQNLSHINVMGGCCGTDHRHVEAICGAVKAA